MMKIKLLAIISLISLSLPMHNIAQEIRMGPPIVELMTTPSSSQTFYISLANQTDEDVSITMLVKSMTMTPQGMPMPVDSSDRSAAQWLTIHEQNVFTLKGYEKKRVRCTFKPPLKVKPGGYYAMILARAAKEKQMEPSNTSAGGAFRVRFQFASVVLAMIKGANIQAKIEPEAPTIFGGNRYGSLTDRDWYVKIPVRNDGNIHVVLEGSVNLYSESGQLIHQIGLTAGRGYLLPEQRREFKADGTGPLPDGTYVADIKIGQPRINKNATERIPFYVLDGQVYPGQPGEEEADKLDMTTQGFILDKFQLNTEVTAGGRRVQVVKISNVTGQPIQIESNIINWDQDEKGDIIFPAQSKHGQSLGNKIAINPSSFLLDPNKKKMVKLIIEVPKDAAGEYYDAIVFNKKGVELTNLASLLQTQSVLTSVIVKKTGNPASELLDFKIKQIKDKGTELSVIIENKGNVTLYPEGNISIFDMDNARVGDPIVFGEKSFILPKNKRIYKIEWGRILRPGKHRAELTATVDQSAKPLKNEITFIAQ